MVSLIFCTYASTPFTFAVTVPVSKRYPYFALMVIVVVYEVSGRNVPDGLHEAEAVNMFEFVVTAELGDFPTDGAFTPRFMEVIRPNSLVFGYV